MRMDLFSPKAQRRIPEEITCLLMLLSLKSTYSLSQNFSFEGPNIALHKTAHQYPGVYSLGYAKLAVDGNLTQDANSQDSYCAHTNFTEPGGTATWTVDLGRSFRISGVVIYNRNLASERQRLKNFTIIGSNNIHYYQNNEGQTTRLYQPQFPSPTPSFRDSVIRVPISNKTPTRNLTVAVSHNGDTGYKHDSGKAILTLCEVQIYAFVCELPAVKNGNVVSGNITASRTNASVFCQSGYTPLHPIVTCTDLRTWDPTPKCDPVNCIYPGNISNGYYTNKHNALTKQSDGFTYQDVITSHCNKGYELINGGNRTCQTNGNWTGTRPTCTSITCLFPGQPLHGHYTDMQTGNTYSDGNKPYLSNISLECEEGFETNSSATLTCLANKSWSMNAAYCIVIRCNSLKPLENGYYTFANGTKCESTQGLPYNTTIKPVCDVGYRLNTDNYTSVCGLTKAWSRENPVCTPITCPSPSLQNAHIQTNDVAKKNYAFLTILYVVCNDSFKSATKEYLSITCVGLGTWEGLNMISCAAAQSPDPKQRRQTAVYVAVPVVAVVVVTAIVIVIILVVRRRQSNKEKKESHRYYCAENTEQTNEYSEISETAITRTEPYKQEHVVCETPAVVVEDNIDMTLLASTSDAMENADYYSFENKEKMPPTAIKTEDLSGTVMSEEYRTTIKNQFKKFPSGLQGDHTAALRLQNRGKNRYKKMYPYDDTRVILEQEGLEGSNYINASFINGFKKTKAFIACQGPSNKTLVDFWKMVWQTKSTKVVMLTNLIEDEKNKCDQYWPTEGVVTFAEYSATHKSSEYFSDFIVRTFDLKRQGSKSRVVKHFQFTAWPDKTVPKYASSIVHFRNKVNITGLPTDAPIIVHCSAGIGRTGTFIALDILVEQARELGYVDIAGCVTTLRKQRVNMVQTEEQYAFLHQALVEALMLATSALSASHFLIAYQELLCFDKGRRKLDIEYAMLKTMSPVQDEQQYVSAKDVRNRKKNRYSNILPVAEYMPALSPAGEGAVPGYINAVFLPSYKTNRAFIITQTPLETTQDDFWKLVYEHDVHTIVMMNGKDELKNEEVYWPNKNERNEYSGITINTTDEVTPEGQRVVTLELEKHCVKRTVHQIQFGHWVKQQSLPSSPQSMLSLLELVQHYQQQSGNHNVLVHCMNGADKSGIFCVLSAVLERMKIEQDVAIVQTIEEMRNYREQIVPSLEQFKFCYDVISCYIQMNDTYSNFT